MNDMYKICLPYLYSAVFDHHQLHLIDHDDDVDEHDEHLLF